MCNKLEGFNLISNWKPTTFTLPEGILDIKKTFDCGQCFRWNNIGNYTYAGVIGDKYIQIKQCEAENGLVEYMTTLDPVYLKDFLNYLGINDDYSYLEHINLTNFEVKAMDKGRGIRILHQDLWETIVSFIISQRNNIPKIKTSIHRLCEAAGTKMVTKNPVIGSEIYYYTFPTPKQIVNLGITGLQKCGLGYRAEYIYTIALEFDINPLRFYDYNNKSKSGQETVDFLMRFRGIGPKVANCIALFGYNKLDMFPIDIWISRAIDQYYNGDIDIERFGKLAGLMQQYIFYYMK